ncbi:MAG TPA: Glu-tRNA(Gln) amidotransferase subunit GatE [Candidatus Nanoarchaeia archaeon]|nr:Glu-tRNA(Gln) amidotransferase subunit GatE [Candidatus Nanoarchaeia archaeon]
MNDKKESEIDYEKLGLKCGLEIHQQLDSGKLFCSCPSELGERNPDVFAKRYLRATASELGEIDVAAMQEIEKGKYFVYEGYRDSTCLVEFDEEPPHEMNKEALNIALQTAVMLKAKVVDQIQVMRKIVIDGSNTSGFQRTALIAIDGELETSQGKVKISTIFLEEEAARIIAQEKDFTRYRLDRLGIPLIEIDTDASIKNPQHCREVAEKLGMILRSTERVKRGIGTIRQDVNVSISEGNRVEIKGAQDLRQMAKYVEYEALRQKKLAEIRTELRKRNPALELKVRELDNLFRNSNAKILKNVLENKGRIFGAKLSKFSGLLGIEVQPGRRFGTELSDYAKIFGVGGLIHSDEDFEKYGISSKEISELRNKLECDEEDAFIIIADEEERAQKALRNAFRRAELQLKTAVPKEVRKANPDATTSYLRPIPGAARMYPETDVIPVAPDISRIKIPELISERAERYGKLELSKDIALHLSKSNKREFFEKLVGKYQNIAPQFIAETLINAPKELRTRLQLDPEKISESHIEQVLKFLDEGKISKEAVFEIFVEIAKGKDSGVVKSYFLLADEELENEIKRIIDENKGGAYNVLIGKVMQRLRGKADGRKITELVKKLSGIA